MTAGPEGLPQTPPALSAEEAAALAKRHGLPSLGGRPPFGDYVRSLWGQRSFIWTLSTAQTVARNSSDRLGMLWTVLNPLLLIGSYYLVFGLLVPTTKGTTNFIAFLAIGVVIFGYMASSITRGSKSIVNNIGLVRALRFPRAVLPVAETLTQVVTVLPAIAVLMVVVIVTGEPVRWHWLLLPVALAIQTAILGGMVLIAARLVNISRDMTNLIPVAIRVLRYVSGVFFSIEAYAARFDPIVGDVLMIQPFALPIALVRQCLLEEAPIQWMQWAAGLGWAVVLPAFGLWFFWRDEAKYGRA